MNLVLQCTEIYQITVDEFFALKRFFDPCNLDQLLCVEKTPHREVVQKANMLLLNYCTTIKLLLEKIERAIKANLPDHLKPYRAYISSVYDEHLSYRFMIRLRNYLIHNRMPITKLVISKSEQANLL